MLNLTKDESLTGVLLSLFTRVLGLSGGGSVLAKFGKFVITCGEIEFCDTKG